MLLDRVYADATGAKLNHAALLTSPRPSLSPCSPRSTIDGERVRALPRDFQVHPFRPKAISINWLRYRAGAYPGVKLDIPLKSFNEERCPGIKEGGWLLELVHKLPVYASGDSIPDFLMLDLRGLKVGDKIMASQVELNDGLLLVRCGAAAAAAVNRAGCRCCRCCSRSHARITRITRLPFPHAAAPAAEPRARLCHCAHHGLAPRALWRGRGRAGGRDARGGRQGQGAGQGIGGGRASCRVWGGSLAHRLGGGALVAAAARDCGLGTCARARLATRRLRSQGLASCASRLQRVRFGGGTRCCTACSAHHVVVVAAGRVRRHGQQLASSQDAQLPPPADAADAGGVLGGSGLSS